MTFEKNLFRVLHVSIYDDKATINERADELSFENPTREEIIDRARNILLNPKKRIAAEVRYFIDDEIDNLFSVENVLANREQFEAFIITIDSFYSKLDAEKIRSKINQSRKKSKFPAIQDTAAIKAELKNIRYDIREKIQTVLRSMNHSERVIISKELAEHWLVDEPTSNLGSIAEDFFDTYRLEMNSYFADTTKEINSLLTEIDSADANALDKLEQKISGFSNAIKPLDKISLAIGANKFDESEKIFNETRDMAIKLFNEKDLIDESLKITRILEENFSHLPRLDELIQEDKKNQPSRGFREAKAALDKIQEEINKRLHFEKNFEVPNMEFYLNHFEPQHEITLQNVMNQFGYKPNEWKFLNSMAAGIYIQVGDAISWTLQEEGDLALTWDERVNLTLKLFQKALPYAETSGDTKIISHVRERIDEWLDVIAKKDLEGERKIPQADSGGSYGCLILLTLLIVIVAFIFFTD